MRDAAAALALQVGCLDPSKPVSRTNSSRAQFVTADANRITITALPRAQVPLSPVRHLP
ncbi:hypothetical protein [Mycobacteroides abscessus]|uniref:hypothetical protein n=1 Tax=Mycobacteroides abscessus TaxID=36809 RepID=UPI001403C48B|nr:hypothetical protein [Mycobacteroides abscessus]